MAAPTATRTRTAESPLVTGFGAPPRIALITGVALALVVATVVAAVLARGGADRTVSTPFLTYSAPAGWTVEAGDPTAPLTPSALTGTVRGPAYSCDGETHVRGFAAAALLPTLPSAGAPDRAERLVRWFAATSYGANDGRAPEVTVAPPRPVRVAGPDGSVDATVTEAIVHAAAPEGCAATRGTVLVLAAPAAGGAALLLVAGDAQGGPAAPTPPERATLDAVLDSVRLGPG